LAVYVNEYDRLPCPARLDQPVTSAEYGREATTCDGSLSGHVRVEYPASSGNYVIIGGVPFYDLHMPNEYLGDSWNGRYLYAVSEAYITAASTGGAGHIRVVDTNGTSITDDAVWALVSHGNSRMGAYSAKAGSVGVACAGATKDVENCDNDGIFTDAVFNDGSVEANFFDDLTRWETRMSLYTIGATGAEAGGEGDGLLLDGWPDVISCTNDSHGNKMFLYLNQERPSDSTVLYRFDIGTSSTNYQLFYNDPAQTYSSNSGVGSWPASDCIGESIAEIVADGRAYYFD